MSLELNDLPRAVFSATIRTNCSIAWYDSSHEYEGGLRKFLEVPITGDEFEVPTVAMSTFIDMVRKDKDGEHQAIVASLYANNASLRYSTVDRYMRDVLIDDFKSNNLLKCIAKGKNSTKTYYATYGTVFDEEFDPVFMCSWKMKREYVKNIDNGVWETVFKFLYPIIRISPSIYLSQQDTMEKFLVRKFSTLALSNMVNTPYVSNLPFRIQLSYGDAVNSYAPSLRIEESPFNIRAASQPDINTTNEELRQAAINHIEEVIQ